MASRIALTLGIGAAAVVLLVALLWMFQRRLIYFPSGTAGDPGIHGLPEARQVSLQTGDGLRLGAWFAEPPTPGRGAVIVFNGNGGNRGARAGLARWLVDAGWSVLLFDYRGYGGNPGAPTEAGLLLDAAAARSWVDENAGGPVVYLGESLGTGVAVATAIEHPPAALILRSPFTSLVDVARRHYPLLPVSWLLSDRFASIDRVSRLAMPLLVVAGDHDRVVPVELSRQLFAASAVPAKRLVIVPGADHNDPALADGPLLVAATLAFLDQNVAAAPAAATTEAP